MSNDETNNTPTEEPTTSPDAVDILLEKLAAKLSELESRAASTNSAHQVPPDVPRFITRW